MKDSKVMSRRQLTRDEVQEARKLKAEGRSIQEILVLLDLVQRISPMALYNATIGNTYKDVPHPPSQSQTPSQQAPPSNSNSNPNSRPGMQRQDMQMFQNIFKLNPSLKPQN
jgi:hypothetical protein